MNLIEKATVLEYHRHRIEKYERGSVQSLGWRGVDSQQARFEVLAGIGDLNGCSVLDVGCGQGDLKAFFDRASIACTYVGIDNQPEFIEVAKARYGNLPDTHFFQADFTTAWLPEADYVLASGALNYRCASPTFHRELIEKMLQASRKGVGFNMLRADRFPDHPLLVGHDIESVLAFCRTLSPDCRMIEGYLDDDFTVFLLR